MSQKKINAIVYSNDKASQLKLFLESAKKNATGFDFTVIYNYSNEDFKTGYEIVTQNERYEDITFIHQEDLKEQLLGLLKSDYGHSCFFMDDDLFYRRSAAKDAIKWLDHDEDVFCFSYRLGENVTHCYTLNSENVMHDIEVDGDFMTWDWTLHYLDFGYPCSLNGHVFRTKELYKFVKRAKFFSIEELESQLFEITEQFPRNKMTSYIESSLVNVPIGRVQMSVENEMTMTLKDVQARKFRKIMNEQFLKGEAPKFDDIKFEGIEGCHQELDLGYKLAQGKGALDAIASKKYGKLFDDLEEEQQDEIRKAIDAVAEIAENFDAVDRDDYLNETRDEQQD